MRLSLSIAVAILICITSQAALADASASGSAGLKQCIDYVLSGKFPQAIKGLQALLANPSPDVVDQEVRAWLIDAHLGNGDTALAMSELQSLEKQYPDYAGEVHHLVARRYFDQGKYPEAIAELKISVELNKLPKEHEHVKEMHRRLMLSYVAVGDMTNAYSELRILMNDFADRVYEFVAAESTRWGSRYPDA